ncbi:MAG: cysteine desulfurase [Anaerolineaceae bacterium]|nr:cysteine desulfurase [Anaerolineaceae bacterium]
MFDSKAILKDFPLLLQTDAQGKRICYLDSGATSQKPKAVMDALSEYYSTYNANVHRGIYAISERATEATEVTRTKIRDFIHAASSSEIIYTRNATESINLVARSWGEANLKAGDVVILSEMEHHSNLVPWYMLAERIGIRIEFIPVTDEFEPDLDAWHKLLKETSPKLVSLTGMSNVLGTIPPIRDMVREAHEAGALFLMDGAQAVPHMPVDVQDLDVDFLAFSAHKMLGPTGLGVLYGKKSLLNAMPPFLGGGDMIGKVHLGSFTCNELPYKFEAGTPSIAEEVCFGAAIDYLTALGMDAVFEKDHQLTEAAIARLSDVPGLKLFGPKGGNRGSAVSFTLDYVHPHDVADILGSRGVCVRAGHHCAMPLHERFNVPATTRASLYIYNTEEDIERLFEGLMFVYKLFG